MSSNDPISTQSLGAESAGDRSERCRLERQVSRLTITVDWLHDYASEHQREPRVHPKYVRQAITDFEAQIAAMNVRLCMLTAARVSTGVQAMDLPG
jgi:hypothetical protein